MSTEALYPRLPVFLQNAAVGLTGWRTERSRYGGGYERLASQIADRERWSADRIAAWRDRRIQEFVAHAAQHVPYYRTLGVEPGDVTGIDDLGRLPVVTKDLIRAHLDDFIAADVSRRERTTAHTSGTTGAGFVFVTTRSAVQEQWATWWRYRHRFGIERSISCAYFGGRVVVPLAQDGPPFWRYNRPSRQILFSGYHMSDANLASYVDELRRRKPAWFHGYPSLLSLLAAHLIERNQDLGYRVRWLTTGAENLSDHQKLLIEKAFGVSPRQHYGLAEAVANASECPSGKLHVDEDFCAFELVPLDDVPGAMQIVGTNLSNPAMPMIRYATGDLAEFGDACSCGRSGRVVSNLDGRAEDYVTLPNGARLGRLDHLFKDIVTIREAQIYQPARERVVIRVVPTEGFDAAEEQRLIDGARARLGGEVTIDIEKREALQRSGGGKLRLVISDVR